MKQVELTQKDIVEWVFKGLMTIAISLVMFFVRDFSDALKGVEKSVSVLNVNFATSIERDAGQTRRINRNEVRIDRIEEMISRRGQ